VLVALVIMAALGADAGVARVRAWRAWPRSNSWLAPAALFALTAPITLLQVVLGSGHAATDQRTLAQLGAVLPSTLASSGVADRSVLISDRPVWLSDALGRPVIALPDEPVESVLSLAAQFDASAVVVVEERGRHPVALRTADAAACFTETPLAIADAPAATLFTIAPECLT
jgi:hypothetical protein